jgi:hypothetical protein
LEILYVLCEKKTDVFSQTVEQQIAIERTEQKIVRVIEGDHEQSQGPQAQGGVVYVSWQD